MLGKKIGIDLGTASVRLVVKGEGILVTEPSVVAIRHGDVLASLMGAAALDAASDDADLRLHRPLLGGSIADPVAARALVSHLVTRAVGRQRIFKPDVVIAAMSLLPGDQRRALLEAAMLAGARTAYLLDAPVAAAMGCGMNLSGANGHLVIDIGAGKTDIAVLAMEGTVAGRCLPGHGGQRLHATVAEHVRDAYGVTLPADQVEDVIASLARVGPHEERQLELTGVRDGSEARVTLSSTELAPFLDAHVRPIAGALDEVLNDTPASLIEDIREEGAILCGGAARLEGLDHALAMSCAFAVRRDGEAQLAAVRGTGHALDNLDVLKRNFMYIR
jgi:rod shape-determining protein MreB